MPTLLSALLEYDGKHKDVLEEILDAVDPKPAVLREAVGLTSHEDSSVATGATWLLREWIEAGVAFGAPLIKRLAVELPKVEHHWARLHVCQAVRSMKIAAAHAPAFASFLEVCLQDRRPLPRAWAIDGLHHLGLSHPAFAAAARRAMEAGIEDPAASVRARVRRIMSGE